MLFSLVLTACSKSTKQAEISAPTLAVNEAPTIFIAAPPAQVESVMIARAASKGSTIKPSVNGKLILERELTHPSAEVIAACGDSWFGRKVRVVMSLQPANGGTQLTERRFIVGGAPIVGGDCAFPLSPEDREQSLNAMNEVKAQAETAQ